MAASLLLRQVEASHRGTAWARPQPVRSGQPRRQPPASGLPDRSVMTLGTGEIQPGKDEVGGSSPPGPTQVKRPQHDHLGALSTVAAVRTPWAR
jgi:hypothetical protein